jgi:hypothetical protein
VLQEQTIKTGRNSLFNTCVARADHETGISTLCNTCVSRADHQDRNKHALQIPVFAREEI